MMMGPTVEEMRYRIQLQRGRNASLKVPLIKPENEKEVRRLRRRLAEATRRKILATERLAAQERAKDYAERRMACAQLAESARSALDQISERRQKALENLKALDKEFNDFVNGEINQFEAFLQADHGSRLIDIIRIEDKAREARDAALVALVASDPSAERLKMLLRPTPPRAQEDQQGIVSPNKALVTSLHTVAESARLARYEVQKSREGRALSQRSSLIEDRLKSAISAATRDRDLAINEYSQLTPLVKQRIDALPSGQAREDSLLLLQTSTTDTLLLPRLGLPIPLALQADQRRLAQYRSRLHTKLLDSQSRLYQDVEHFRSELRSLVVRQRPALSP